MYGVKINNSNTLRAATIFLWVDSEKDLEQDRAFMDLYSRQIGAFGLDVSYKKSGCALRLPRPSSLLPLLSVSYDLC